MMATKLFFAELPDGRVQIAAVGSQFSKAVTVRAAEALRFGSELVAALGPPVVTGPAECGLVDLAAAGCPTVLRGARAL